MKAIFSCAAAFLTLATVTSADAKGCLKGAVVGGTAGHFAGHHGILGAAAGCVWPSRKRRNGHECRTSRLVEAGRASSGRVRLLGPVAPSRRSDCQRAATIRRSSEPRATRSVPFCLKRPIRRSRACPSDIPYRCPMGHVALLGGRLQSRCGPPRQGYQGVVQTPADTPAIS